MRVALRGLDTGAVVVDLHMHLVAETGRRDADESGGRGKADRIVDDIVDRAFEPVGGHRLEDIIHRIAIERLDREVIMRGDEDHHGGLRLFGEMARDAQPVHLGHGHVEQHQIGLEFFSEAQRRGAIARRADHAHRGNFGTDYLHALHSEWFIIDDQGS